jgi:putative endonuclease
MADAWVYLLRCADGSLYTGWTNDLPKRLAAHTAGTASRYTRSRLPVELALALPQPDRSAAMREEARIKRLRRGQKVALVSAADRATGPGRR